MRIDEYIAYNQKPFLSLELVPPRRGGSINDIFKTIDQLISYSPKFINVTNRYNSVFFKNCNGKPVKTPLNNKPGTLGVSVAINQKFSIPTVPHLVVKGMDKLQLEDLLIDLNYLGFKNIFVIRGDQTEPDASLDQNPDQYQYASSLVEQINQMNQGIYSTSYFNNSPTEFCIGVAGYPEKHYQSVNFDYDLNYLKEKIDRGASYIITQIFYSFSTYVNFLKKAREIGIDVPIIPGLKPITSCRQLYSLPPRFFISIPTELAKNLESAKSPQQEKDIGIAYMNDLINQLLDFGVPAIHLFTMGKNRSVKALLDQINPRLVK